MAKTNAEHQSATRARRSARIKRMEAALREIGTLPDDGYISWCKRIASDALSPPPNEREP